MSHLVLHGGFVEGRLIRMREGERQQAEAILTLMRHGWGRAGSAFIEAFATMFIPDGTRDQIESLASLQQLTTSPENAVALRRTIDTLDVGSIVEEIGIPTLVVHASGDSVQPLDQGRELASRIPGAEFVLLESRNHIPLPQEAAWQTFFDRLEEFVGVSEAERGPIPERP